MALLDLFAFWLYRSFLVPLALLLLYLFRPFLPQKLQETLQDRQNLVLQPLPARPIWIHASSGEIEYAKPVIRELRAQFPQCNILVTFFSPSAKPLLAKIQGVDLILPLPFDQRFAILDFLHFYKPQCALFARTDVWPEMSYQLKKLKIPTLLFAATLAEKSSRVRFPGRMLTRFTFNNLKEIQCVSKDDEKVLLSLPISSPIQIAGDTRYDQVLFRLESDVTKLSIARPLSPEKIFVMGSTWPEDEAELVPALQSWIASGHRAILVPHEVNAEHIKAISKQLHKYNIVFEKYSECQNWQTPLLVVDCIGVLQEFYKWADVAFVGGSFKSKVHSVMEALCLGIPVLVGPQVKNNREALQFSQIPLESHEQIRGAQKPLMAVTICKDSTELLQGLERISHQKMDRSSLLREISSRKGASKSVVRWTQGWI